MKTRTTALDLYASTAASFLEQALNDGSKNDIPRAYLDRYCEQVVNAMWRCVSNAIGSYELYGDVPGLSSILGLILTLITKMTIHAGTALPTDSRSDCGKITIQ